MITVKDLLPYYKNKTALGRALGVTRAAVTNWGDGPIPSNHELKIRLELLPDVEWPSDRKAAV